MQDWITSQHMHHTLGSDTHVGPEGEGLSKVMVRSKGKGLSQEQGLAAKAKAAAKHDHNNDVQHTLGSDTQADPEDPHLCNMDFENGKCQARFETKRSLIQHIVHTKDGYHSSIYNPNHSKHALSQHLQE